MNTKLHKEIYQKIMSGRTFTEIAHEYGFKKEDIRKIIVKLNKQDSRIRIPGPIQSIKHQRNIEIHQKILAGKTIKEVSDKYDLSKERIRQIYHAHGGSHRHIKKIYKETRAKRREQKYQYALKIAQQYARSLGYIPLYRELSEVLLKNGGTTHLIKIQKELLKTINLPRQIDKKRNATRERMLQDLKRIYTIKQRAISKKNLQKYGAMSYSSYRVLFGSYKNACMLAGIPYPKRGGWWKKQRMD